MFLSQIRPVYVFLLSLQSHFRRLMNKGKGNVYYKTSHEGPKGREEAYVVLLFREPWP